MLTFNTSCYGCHVSQLATNYIASSDTYRTTWGSRASIVKPATALPPIMCANCASALRKETSTS